MDTTKGINLIGSALGLLDLPTTMRNVLILFWLIACVGRAESDTKMPAGVSHPVSISLGFESGEEWNRWKEIRFPKLTQTRYHYDTAGQMVCATSESAASGMAVKVGDLLETYPVLEWEWKIDHVVLAGDGRYKKNDDYAARVYVNFGDAAEGGGLWDRVVSSVSRTLYGTAIPARSLIFIWANVLPRGNSNASPYTSRARLIALESGNGRTGRWVKERVQLADTYHRVFGEEAPPLHSIGIMTDSDNTGSRASACYRNIRLSRE